MATQTLPSTTARPAPLNDTTTVTMPRFGTAKQVAEMLGCSDDHVYTLMRDGALPYVDISRKGAQRAKLRIPMTQVAAYLEKIERRGLASLRAVN